MDNQMAKLKILKTGETDIESTDIWRFCMHSDYPTQKIYASGQTTLTIPAGSDTGTKTIAHGLGYAPIVMAMFETDNSRYVKVTGQVKFISRQVQKQQYFSVNISTNNIISAEEDGGLATTSYVSINDIVRFTSRNVGVLPSPLQANTDYYVKAIADQYQFTVSTTQGGATVDITDGGGSAMDIFENITNPLLENLDGTYSVQVSDTEITFSMSPSVNTPYVAHDVDIPIYYLILYDQI